MNQQKLPNAQTVLILGIVAIVGSCCCSGVVGLVCGLIGLNLYKKDNALYLQSPEMYLDYNNLNTGRILCIIGIVLGALQLAYFIFIMATVGWDGYMEMIQNATKMGGA